MKKIRCPQCKKECFYSLDNPHRPFCCKECKNADFLNWEEGEYNIPGPEAKPEELVEAIKKKSDDKDDS